MAALQQTSIFSKSIINLRKTMVSDYKSSHKDTMNKLETIHSECDTYKMPMQFRYHQHIFMFTDQPKECKLLKQFHDSLELYETTVIERYGWMPDAEFRINIDCNACLLGVAMDAQSGQVKAIITLFDVPKDHKKIYQIEKELALIVLPPFQRQYIATDLTRLMWSLFVSEQDNDGWVYVINSNKSRCFLQSFKRRYPEVRFRLIRP
eukprot:567621_1